MGGAGQSAAVGRVEQALTRRLRDLRRVAAHFRASSMTPLQVCEAALQGRLIEPKARRFFSGLPDAQRHYWIASLYALLMSKSRRQQLAAYFTPPHLAQYLLERLSECGITPGRDRILDPASGGAAFLVPLAAQIAREHRRRGSRPEAILQTIQTTLSGIEIAPQLASLSRLLLGDLLAKEIAATNSSFVPPIRRANTLKLPPPENAYDAVIGNPPYGRMYRPSPNLLARYSDVITDSYVNLYALFIEQSLRWVRPGGIVCLIVPMSFIGGPHFSALRHRILDTAWVRRIDPIDKRSDTFLDVSYDVCVLLLQKKDPGSRRGAAASALVMVDALPRHLGVPDLPAEPSRRVWALPDGKRGDRLFESGLQTIGDYGFTVRAGYFVWNREQDRYRLGRKPRRGEVPLYWSHNVRANALCEPRDGKGDAALVGFVKITNTPAAVVGTDAIILQRTSNRRQKRRLIAGLIRKSKVPGERGFVSENHTILIVPDRTKPQSITLRELCRLLNTEAVDARFRRMSGSVSVSAKALRELPLPAANTLKACLKSGIDDETAAARAYLESVTPDKVARVPRASGVADDN